MVSKVESPSVATGVEGSKQDGGEPSRFSSAKTSAVEEERDEETTIGYSDYTSLGNIKGDLAYNYSYLAYNTDANSNSAYNTDANSNSACNTDANSNSAFNTEAYSNSIYTDYYSDDFSDDYSYSSVLTPSVGSISVQTPPIPLMNSRKEDESKEALDKNSTGKNTLEEGGTAPSSN